MKEEPAADLDALADEPAGARPRRADLPRQGPRRSVADGARRGAPAPGNPGRPVGVRSPAIVPAPGRRRRRRCSRGSSRPRASVLAVFGWTHRAPPGAGPPRPADLFPPPPNANFHTLGANVGGVALSPTAADSRSAPTKRTACTVSGSGTWTRSSPTPCPARRKRSSRSGLPTAARSGSSRGESSRRSRRLRARRPRASSPT